jgi:hypothetical protein
MESSLEKQSIIYNYLDNVHKSVIQFETYCENVGLSKEVIYDTNGIQIIKPLTHHEVKIAAIKLRQKYKDVDTKINVLRSFLGKFDLSFSTNNDIQLVQDFFSTLDKTRFNGIYQYKSAYINALKRLGIP